MYIPYIYLFFDKISWVFLGIRGIPPGSAPAYGAHFYVIKLCAFWLLLH